MPVWPPETNSLLVAGRKFKNGRTTEKFPFLWGDVIFRDNIRVPPRRAFSPEKGTFFPKNKPNSTSSRSILRSTTGSNLSPFCFGSFLRSVKDWEKRKDETRKRKKQTSVGRLASRLSSFSQRAITEVSLGGKVREMQQAGSNIPGEETTVFSRGKPPLNGPEMLYSSRKTQRSDDFPPVG